MAISRYGISTTTGGGTANPRTFSFDVGTGDDRLLIVFGLFYNGSGTDILSGVTYGGVAMTKVNAVNNASNAFYTSMWYLINPASGSNNVVATFSATPTSSWFTCVSYHGCDQSSQPDTSGSLSVNANYTINTTTTVDDDFLLAWSAGNEATTAGTNATQIHTVGFVALAAYEHSSNPLTPAGAYSMTVNQAGSAHNGFHWLSIKPAAGAAADTTKFFQAWPS